MSLGPPGPGRVRVDVEGCGVCGSNLPVWEGRPWFDYPLAPGRPGHEAWGRVEAVGDGVDGSLCGVGDRVALLDEAAFAEAVDVAAADVVVLPAALEDRPFPGEALGCAFNAAARSGFSAGQTVCVVGIGFMGAVLTALAAAAGARVVAVSRRLFSLEVAGLMGAASTFPLDGAVEALAELTGGEMCDVVVEAVGSQASLDLAARLTAVRGRLVIAGYHQDGMRSVDLQLWNWRGIDVVNAHERDRAVRLAGVTAAASAVVEGRLDPTPLYTHRYPLEGLGEAMEAMAGRPDGFLKALVGG